MTVILGMPEGVHREVMQDWASTLSGRTLMYLSPASLDDPDTEECPQCILLEKTLQTLDESLKRNLSGPEGIWLEAPIELDPRRLIDELIQIPAIRLDSVTTWIDSSRFLQDFSSEQEWEDRIQGTTQTMSSGARHKPVLETWIDQLEFCNAHVLMGMEVLPHEEQDSIRSILKALNPDAIQIRSDQADKWREKSFS